MTEEQLEAPRAPGSSDLTVEVMGPQERLDRGRVSRSGTVAKAMAMTLPDIPMEDPRPEPPPRREPDRKEPVRRDPPQREPPRRDPRPRPVPGEPPPVIRDPPPRRTS